MLHELLNDKKLVLASASPRRLEIFKMLGLNPLIVPPKVHEPIDDRLPWQLVKHHASHKANTIRKLFDENTVIVAADTLVYIDKTVLGKPENRTDAAKYLNMLSGKSHTVYTGISILWRNREVTSYEKSTVRFNVLTEQEIRDYIKTKEPMDKAGAYGIQGFGCQFITGISGCYFNVMGFPVHLFYKMLNQLMCSTT